MSALACTREGFEHKPIDLHVRNARSLEAGPLKRRVETDEQPKVLDTYVKRYYLVRPLPV